MERKYKALERQRLLHTAPDRVLSPLFRRIPFFDPHDKLQVKYEMLRSHGVDGVSVSEASRMHGYTRQGFYQMQQGFYEEGMAGLLEKKPGRHGPVKCTAEAVAFLVRQKQSFPELSGRQLAERLFEQQGIAVHRRTVEKVVQGMARRKKNRPPLRHRIVKEEFFHVEGKPLFLETGGKLWVPEILPVKFRKFCPVWLIPQPEAVRQVRGAWFDTTDHRV